MGGHLEQFVRMSEEKRHQHVERDDRSGDPRPRPDDHEDRADDLAEVDEVADGHRQAGALEGGRDIAEPEAQLRDAVEEDEEADRDAQDQPAGVLYLYLTEHPYGVVVDTETGFPAFISSSAATT